VIAAGDWSPIPPPIIALLHLGGSGQRSTCRVFPETRGGCNTNALGWIQYFLGLLVGEFNFSWFWKGQFVCDIFLSEKEHVGRFSG
jgi:hypothetical protein